jgi:hypothetical protein
MWNPAGPTRGALALLMAAGVAFLGSAMMLKAGSAVTQFAGRPGANVEPGLLLAAVAVLLAATGFVLLAFAGKEFLDERRRSHPR